MNINPLIELLNNIINLYNFAVLIYIAITWLSNFGIINNHNYYVKRIKSALSQIVEPALDYIRKYVPLLGGLDFSPIVLLLALRFTQSILFNYFYFY